VKSREISDYDPFTLYLSYFTQLCRKVTQDTEQRRKTRKKVQKGRKMNSLASNSPQQVAKESKGRRAYLLASNAPPVCNGE